VKVDDHPLIRLVGSPVLYDGLLYVPTSSYEEVGKPPGYVCCTFRGSVAALDATTGKLVWKAYAIPDEPHFQRKTLDGRDEWGPSGNAIWASPTVDRKRGALYVAVGNAYTMPETSMSDAVVALNVKTGKTLWVRQLTTHDVYECKKADDGCGENIEQDADIATSPALSKLPNGKDILTVGQKNGVGYALDPDKQGSVVWRYRAGEGGALGGIEWGMAVDGEQAYFPVADVGKIQPGGLHAVKLLTGERVWYTPARPPLCGTASRGCSGAQSAAITVIPGVVFSGAFDGGIRAYSTKDGSILWEFDTNREFSTVNGIRAKGGSINGPAPTVAGGMVYVSSGDYRGIRGNVLLAFGVN
jgi:polyvinyl alcohol dehydrogenase (cytochrome)